MINKRFCTYEDLFKGLDKYKEGTIIIWRDIKHKIVFSDNAYSRFTGKKSIFPDLEGMHKPTCKSKGNIDNGMYNWCSGCDEFKEPKRNEKCFCGSRKKYKKCCIN